MCNKSDNIKKPVRKTNSLAYIFTIGFRYSLPHRPSLLVRYNLHQFRVWEFPPLDLTPNKSRPTGKPNSAHATSTSLIAPVIRILIRTSCETGLLNDRWVHLAFDCIIAYIKIRPTFGLHITIHIPHNLPSQVKFIYRNI